jgi:ketosteroid isomerase-like protein
MKNKTMKKVLPGIIMILLLACNTKDSKTENASVTTTVDKDQVMKDIQAKENEFAELYNKGELKDIGYYAEDATTFFQNRPPLIGKDAIVDYLKAAIISKTDRISFTTKDVFVSSDGNQVVEIGYFKVVDSTNVTNTGNYMSLFEKRDGKYVCVRDMSASDTPAQ